MGRERILVVDDELLVAKHQQSILKSMGYDVPDVAISGKEAIAKAEVIQPELIIMDIKLGMGIDGIEAATIIKEKYNIPVIYVTAYCDKDTLERAKRTTPLGYINKPFTRNDIMTTVETALYNSYVQTRIKRELGDLVRLRDALKSTMDAVVVTDQNAMITYVNKAAEEIIGGNKKNLLGEYIKEFISIKDNDQIEILDDYLARVINDNKSIMLPVGAHLVRKDGQSIAIYDSISPIHNDEGESTGVVIVMCDGSQLENIQVNLQNHVARLHSMYEKERSKISQVLHDEVGQALSVLKMDVAYLAKEPPESRKVLIERMYSLLDETVNKVRQIYFSLSLSTLRDLGLVAAIEMLVEETTKLAGCKYKLDLNVDVLKPEPKRDIAIYRIAQEILLNVAHHAEAGFVMVKAWIENEEFKLQVIDDGKGIKNENISNPKSSGIAEIYERATTLHGRLEIEPGKEGGTSVTLTLPIV